MHQSDRNGQGTGRQKQSNRTRYADASGDSLRHRWGVILAGGDGTRLQPLTRLACGDNRPKQFCPLLGGKTLLASTQKRIAKSIDSNQILFVLTKKHEPFYREELKQVPRHQKIVQPYNQGTLPAILWSLLRLYRVDQHALVAFFPSDHHFARENEFISTVEETFDYVDERPDSVVLLGAVAERPETQYGWIEPEHSPGSGPQRQFAQVRRFWEKPPLEIAIELLSQGCLWNTFVMVGTVGAFLKMIRQTSPVFYETFEAAITSAGRELEEQKMRLVYDTLDAADFSKEVLALSTERLLVANCGEVGWSDLGEPRRFIEALTENGPENSWTVGDLCNKCGLTREQIVTLSGHNDAKAAIEETATLASLG